MQVANPNRAQFQKNSIFIPSDFPHFLKSTIGKELAPSKSGVRWLRHPLYYYHKLGGAIIAKFPPSNVESH